MPGKERYCIWTPTPTDNMLYFYFDGQKEPGLKIKFSDLFSGKVYPFTKPICGNEIGVGVQIRLITPGPSISAMTSLLSSLRRKE